jgi:hypothetical protein
MELAVAESHETSLNGSANNTLLKHSLKRELGVVRQQRNAWHECLLFTGFKVEVLSSKISLSSEINFCVKRSIRIQPR